MHRKYFFNSLATIHSGRERLTQWVGAELASAHEAAGRTQGDAPTPVQPT